MKAIALSPSGFPDDFSRLDEFFQEAAALHQPGVLWSGPWRDDAGAGADAGIPPRAAVLTAREGATRDFDPVLVFGWRSGEEPLIRVPSNPVNDWSNTEAAELYVQAVTEVAEAHRPAFIFLGNESDLYYTADPADYARWIQVYEAAYARIKAVAPDTQVGPIFQYERMAGIGRLAGATTPAWDALTAHDLSRVDVLGLTVYPFLAHPTPQAIPDDYFAPLIARVGDLPLALTETGWPAEAPEGFDPPWEVSEAHQVNYLAALNRILGTRDVPLVTWLWLHPPARPANGALSLLEWRIFHSISLRDAQGARRPVYQAWEAFAPGAARRVAVRHAVRTQGDQAASWVDDGRTRTEGPYGTASPQVVPDELNGSAAPSPQPPSAPRAVAVPDLAAPRDVDQELPVVATTQDGVRYRLRVLAEGFDAPTAMVFAPDGRLFVAERPGRVRILAGGRVSDEPALTIPDVVTDGEAGLLGLALDPEFSQSRWLYLYYTARRPDGGAANRIVRYREAAGRLAERVVLADGIPAGMRRNGGRLRIGPAGEIYVATGDAARAELAQDLASLAGKVLRLDRDGRTPRGNPYASPVYASGHRDPRALDWHPATGALWVFERGPGGVSELNRIEPGADYGWPRIIGREMMPGMRTPAWLSAAGLEPADASFYAGRAFPRFANDLLVAAGQGLLRLRVEPVATGWIGGGEWLIDGRFGALGAVTVGPGGSVYVATRRAPDVGGAAAARDRVMRLAPAD